jgi:hypothetical protein
MEAEIERGNSGGKIWHPRIVDMPSKWLFQY